MPSNSINQIKNSINSFEYEDEILIVMDIGTVSEETVSADIIDGTLIVSKKNPDESDQDIEINLPDEFSSPEIDINNGVITVTQSLSTETGDSENAEDDDN